MHFHGSAPLGGTCVCDGRGPKTRSRVFVLTIASFVIVTLLTVAAFTAAAALRTEPERKLVALLTREFGLFTWHDGAS